MHSNSFEHFLSQMSTLLTAQGSSPIMTEQEIVASGHAYVEGLSADQAADVALVVRCVCVKL